MGVLLAIHVLVTIFLILVVLAQKNEGGSSLFANSGGGGMFNARGASNILTKTTWVLAAIFLVNCVVMAMINSTTIRNSQTIVGENGGDVGEPESVEKAKSIDGKIAESATVPSSPPVTPEQKKES
ncbi:MAG: preprotein translocase subunit SecG [Holosporales bacterium]|jgi:preprotein translocase subunit SecG|nr:preprotein translocase subunit SecG [Holosporales bacterium]